MKRLLVAACAVTLAGCVVATAPAPDSGGWPDQLNQSNYVAWGDLNEEACYTALNHDVADLCAQWRAAKANERSAESAANANLIASLALLVSGIGMIALFGTLYQSNLSISETRRIGKAQVRGYLAVTEVIACVWDGSNKPSIKISVKNFGQSPVRDLRRNIVISYYARGNLDGRRKSKAFKDPEPGHYLAPNAIYCPEFILFPFEMTEDERVIMDSGRDLSLLVQVGITGKDVFDDPIKIQTKFAALRLGRGQEIELRHIAHREE